MKDYDLPIFTSRDVCDVLAMPPQSLSNWLKRDQVSATTSVPMRIRHRPLFSARAIVAIGVTCYLREELGMPISKGGALAETIAAGFWTSERKLMRFIKRDGRWMRSSATGDVAVMVPAHVLWDVESRVLRLMRERIKVGDSSAKRGPPVRAALSRC